MKFGRKTEKNLPENDKKGTEKKQSLKEKIKKSFNGKYIKNGSYSVAVSVVFVVIIVVINLIVNTLPTKYSEIDVSDQKIFSIGSQTEEFLKNLEGQQ